MAFARSDSFIGGGCGRFLLANTLAIRTEKSDCTNAIASLILFPNENSPKFANKRHR